MFSFIPEKWYSYGVVEVNFDSDTIILCNRLLNLLLVFTLVCVGKLLYNYFKTSITIKHDCYKIVVEYADIFDKREDKKVISFDECFTTKLGEAPSEIKSTSICGQFLIQNHGINVDELIVETGLKIQRKRSEFQNKECYESGRLLPYKDFLLLSFAKLDNYGRGCLTRKEYIRCLEVLWEEIDKYYACRSVAIPILGSGITRFGDELLTKQQLLDIIISSYKMSAYKIKLPAELHIICRKTDDFSLNRVGEYI